MVELLVRVLNLDPKTTAQAHVELALRFLEEGRGLVNKDPVQASEKLYKAAEESVKAAASCLSLDVLRQVEDKGMWTVAELDKAARGISNKSGELVPSSLGYRVGASRVGVS